MQIACLDLEGVLVPEIWIGLAERTGVEALALTTRDNPDYDDLMRHRLGLLDRHRIGLADIEAVVAGMAPLDGASAFLDWLRARLQVVVLSDTFYQLAMPLMGQLGHPTLLCHNLDADARGRVTGYRLRQADPKARAVRAFQSLNFRVIAVGDSYNDTTMLAAAESGILFRPPAQIAREFPSYPVARDYTQLRAAVSEAIEARVPADAPTP
ncbi:MAG: bifunctional phosphoserine phosphatase/homoserine phosphotransferase ThrH [Alphaproteobacteria bacterium]|jgi:phosphoserine/homoserine phosphotransferase|nr:bifunctional phosphoserine phosphatase/homoserine phosphotransferase ThrH [Alphaproteobacteria bacterium]MDP6516083.1 bifunctional phosphoserine phosphatase/homoserine phosphotransferase ThrH [Alphaproteobacteria bacterium]